MTIRHSGNSVTVTATATACMKHQTNRPVMKWWLLTTNVNVCMYGFKCVMGFDVFRPTQWISCNCWDLKKKAATVYHLHSNLLFFFNTQTQHICWLNGIWTCIYIFLCVALFLQSQPKQFQYNIFFLFVRLHTCTWKSMYVKLYFSKKKNIHTGRKGLKWNHMKSKSMNTKKKKKKGEGRKSAWTCQRTHLSVDHLTCTDQVHLNVKCFVV